MAGDRDIREAVLSGDTYTRAKLSTRQVFPISLPWRIRACILTLLVTAFVAPATDARRDLIGSLEGEVVAGGALEPAFALIALAGALVTFVAGVFLVGLQYRAATGELTLEEAKRLLWIEDAATLLALSPGISFVWIGVGLSALGLLAPKLAAGLYTRGVRIYMTGSGVAAVDVWYTSVIGIGLAVVLTSMWWEVRGAVAARDVLSKAK
ncbi:hypothetical protein ACLI4U_08970 [Natrialbaceae archaeon A-CW2]